jgi:hypothetical protein
MTLKALENTLHLMCLTLPVSAAAKLEMFPELPARLVRPGQRVFTILGWTPGLRCVLGGHVMTCGCLVGSYETCLGDYIEIVEMRSRICGKGHCDHLVISRSEHSAHVYSHGVTTLSGR